MVHHSVVVVITPTNARTPATRIPQCTYMKGTAPGADAAKTDIPSKKAEPLLESGRQLINGSAAHQPGRHARV
jgi:hypothetical protein